MNAPMKNKRAPPKKRKTLGAYKLYLDSAATYHRIFVKWYLKNSRETGRVLCGNSNAGVRPCTQKWDLGMFKMWINEEGIANLPSISQLEKDGFRVTTDTHGEWAVYTPHSQKIEFKRNTSRTENMPYIDVRDVTEAFPGANIEAFQEKSIQTVCKNMEGFSRKEVQRDAGSTYVSTLPTLVRTGAHSAQV